MKISKTTVTILVFCMILIMTNWGNTRTQYPDQAKKTLPKFQIELFSGLATLNPSDLNLRPEYDRTYLEYQEDFYSHYDPYSQPVHDPYDFRKITSAFPYGFRLKYHLTPRLALSLGFRSFSREQKSDVTAEFNDMNYRRYILEYNFSPYSLSASAYAPLMGVHFLAARTKYFDLELFFSGGPLFSECRYLISTSRFYSRSGQVISANETVYEITGKSTGVALNAGSRVNVKIMGNLSVFCEGGYAYQTAKNLKGAGELTYYRYTSPDTKEMSGELQWEGYWGIKDTMEFPPLPSNEWEKDDDRVGDFKLDLSGFFLQIGISFGFSLK